MSHFSLPLKLKVPWEQNKCYFIDFASSVVWYIVMLYTQRGRIKDSSFKDPSFPFSFAFNLIVVGCGEQSKLYSKDRGLWRTGILRPGRDMAKEGASESPFTKGINEVHVGKLIREPLSRSGKSPIKAASLVFQKHPCKSKSLLGTTKRLGAHPPTLVCSLSWFDRRARRGKALAWSHSLAMRL